MSFGFEVIGRLGSGGYGDVYRARRLDTGETVVVKYLREASNLQARRWFEREVRILARNFRGCVALLGANVKAPRPFYVMPLLPGGSLTRWSGRLSEAQLKVLATDLAQSLQQLHAAWIYHGDIKPDNLLLSHDGYCRIADPLGNGLGCTVLLSSNHGGTPGYWAPEIKTGGAISAAADSYSYGATLFHIATGQRPLDGQRLDTLVHQYSMPLPVRAAIAACCNPVPSQRPSMAEVLRLLRGETWEAIQLETAVKVGAWLAIGFVGALAAASVLDEGAA